jgi:hypothetical protein
VPPQAASTSASSGPGIQRTVVPPPMTAASSSSVPGVQRTVVPPSRIPAPPGARVPSHGSRPSSAVSVASLMNAAGSVTPTSVRTSMRCASSSLPRNSSGCDDLAMPSRMPPGAIRRAGSTPSRRGPGRSPDPPPARHASRRDGGAPATPTCMSTATSVARVGAAAVPSRTTGEASVPPRAASAGSSRPGSRASSEAADRPIEDLIPSEPDSSDDEVISAVKTKS